MWDTLHRYGVNYVPSDTSNAGWNKLGFCIIYYTKNKITNQPTTLGQLINIPAELSREATQIWIEQPGGRIWYRAGNGSVPINNTKFKAVATTDEVISVTDKVNDLSSKVNDSLEHLKGNHTPVVTDIFDRAGTIDMTTMSDSNKATHKANINKAKNASQNIWNTDTGIRAYGGNYDMIDGYYQGTLKLTQSYKNFYKILVHLVRCDGVYSSYKMWDVWELVQAFATGYCFFLANSDADYWVVFGATKLGNNSFKLSTDTVWSCYDKNTGIVGIYGIKY